MQQHLMRGVGLQFTEIYTIKLKRPGAKPDPSLKKEYPLKMKCVGLAFNFDIQPMNLVVLVP